MKSSNRTVNVSKLSKSCQALNPGLQQALDGGAKLTVRLQEAAKSDPGSPVAKTTPKVKAGPQMTQTEREFKAMLEREFPEATILFERYTFLLSTDCRYSPDFAVIFPSEEKYDPDTYEETQWVRIQFYEVKGSLSFQRSHQKHDHGNLGQAQAGRRAVPLAPLVSSHQGQGLFLES